jgi:hypothetical protein
LLSDRDLEQIVSERLRRLPSPHAPQTLRPRVMAAVGARRRAAVRPWFAWPLAWQAAFVAALVLSVGGGGLWLSNMATAMGWGTPSWLGGPASRVVEAARDVTATTEAMRIFMGAWLSQPMVLCLVALVVVMTAACVTFGAMLGRVADFRIDFRIQGAD